ncbi:sulfatase-like hydrolase/transferase [Maribellus comscasis]|uniref:Sulfatase-like hydrolase/transferase n=2 Tax=Maribellus comscasis TaxID=2681766 RepID=A0A6I6K2W9_9BACT|nr:sulfatase-like hydrolase/transferase [Maribellus comscasis]
MINNSLLNKQILFFRVNKAKINKILIDLNRLYMSKNCIMKGLFTMLFCFTIFSSNSQEKPNILFIVSEDNGPELGCYGAPVKTPNLDKLAKDGILFKNAYVPQSGCSQSRAAFLTGLYPHQSGQVGLATWKYQMYNPETPNIPKSLKAAGYTTGIIGKLHVNPESAFPFDYISPSHPINDSNFRRKNMAGYATDAREFINSTNQSFYLQVNYPDAHAPFLKQVDGLPKKPLTAKDVDALPYMEANNEKMKEATANYYNCIMRLDTYIGDLLKVLKESGKYDNTLIVYIGDHGADLLRGKRTSYEGGIIIPMIISWPGKSLENESLFQMVSTIDLYPTFLDVAGLHVPEYLPGKSLLPLLKGKKTKWRDYLFAEYHTHSNHNPYPQRTVRDNRYKLIYNPISGIENPGYDFTLSHTVKISQGELFEDMTPQVKNAYLLMKNPPEFELYDLKNDPYEMTNLSEDKNYAEILNRLKDELSKWQKATSDPFTDPLKARTLFNMIIETGADAKERKQVPYLDMMDPKLNFDK